MSTERFSRNRRQVWTKPQDRTSSHDMTRKMEGLGGMAELGSMAGLTFRARQRDKAGPGTGQTGSEELEGFARLTGLKDYRRHGKIRRQGRIKGHGRD
jgi:hypothetical protein